MSFVNIIKYIKTTFFLGFYLFPQSLVLANDFQNELDFLKNWSRPNAEKIETKKAQELDQEDSLSLKQAAPQRASNTLEDRKHLSPISDDSPEDKEVKSIRRIRSR